MTPRVFGSIDEIVSALDEPLGSSRPHALTQDDIDAFARLTGDEQWIHVDVDRARTGPFGAPIAHGYLVLSLIPALAADVYQLDVGSARLNYGSRTVRFPAPALVNSTLTVASSFVELDCQGPLAKLTVRHIVRSDGAEKPVCVAETVTAVVT